MAKEGKEKKGGRELAPFRRMGMPRFFDDMERMMERMMGRSLLPEWPRLKLWGDGGEFPYPEVDVYEKDNNLIFKAELPGVTKEDLSIDITDDSVTISGEKKKETKIEEKDYYRSECSYGSFSRSFALPSGTDAGKAKASFKNGVLEVKVPKKAEARKKKITVE